MILFRVLTLVGFVVPNDAPCRGARHAVTGHVTCDAADYRTFNASLSICRGARSDGDSQYEQCNDHQRAFTRVAEFTAHPASSAVVESIRRKNSHAKA